MADIEDGEEVEVQGSSAKPYVLKNTGGVYSCTCPAWRNQSLPIERRTCKHLRKVRGDAAEDARVGGAGRPARQPKASEDAGPPLLLAHSYEGQVDPTGWWLSEKLDGVRAFWDGKSFWSRQGNEFLAPDWFVAKLPDFALDGELWSGRRRFQRTVSIVRRMDRGDDWREVTYVAFDAPKLDAPFEERLAKVSRYFETVGVPYGRAHPHRECRGSEHLNQELARVESLGGEGLMLRKPGSRYEVGRSTTLLKVKRFKDDEARVVGHVAGEGKHQGRLGALEVELKNGKRFSVGTGFSDAERKSPPPVGSTITFRYQELSSDGVPRFPSFVRVCEGAEPAKETAAAPPGAPAPAVAGGKVRHFELVEGASSKFWEIEVSGNQHTVRFGRLGTQGQSKTKAFADAGAAQRDADKLVQEKTQKGYQEK